MNRKYLDDLNVKDRWDLWTYRGKTKNAHNNFRKVYGVDPRETFALNETFLEWLYERLMAYKGFASKVVDLKSDVYLYDWEGEKYTQYDLIEKCLANLKEYLLYKGNSKLYVEAHFKEYTDLENIDSWDSRLTADSKIEEVLTNNAYKAAEMFIVMLPGMWW